MELRRATVTDVGEVVAALEGSTLTQVVSSFAGRANEPAAVFFHYRGPSDSEPLFYVHLGSRLASQSEFMGDLHVSWGVGYKGTLAKLEVPATDLRRCAEWLTRELPTILDHPVSRAFMS